MGEVERLELAKVCGLVVYLRPEDSGGDTDSFTLPRVFHAASLNMSIRVPIWPLWWRRSSSHYSII